MKTRQMRLAFVALVFAMVFASAWVQLAGQALRQAQNPASGVDWAMQAMQALTGGNPVNSVTESGTVVRTVGGDREQGSITLQSSGVMNSEIDLTTDAGMRSDIRTMTGSHPDGMWIDLQGTQHPMSLHNCWSDAVWFFPALSLLADYANPNLVFEDLGPQQYQGGTVEHIRVYRIAQGLNPRRAQLLARMSTVHYYLDSQTAIPLALAYDSHANEDGETNVPAFIALSDYRSVNGFRAPFQIAKLVNGTLVLQITLSNVGPNNPTQVHSRLQSR